MNKFYVKYASSLQEEIICSLPSVEAFCNQHFGSTWEVAKENGATVTMRDMDAPVAEVAEPVAEVAEVAAPAK